MAKIGIFGGTFDPVHVGHLVAADRACCDLDMQKVIFVPAGLPPHKAGQPVTPGEHRLAMVRLAVQDNPRFEVSDLELKRQGCSYTVDTISYFRRLLPDDELYFILGMDSLLQLNTWHDVDNMLKMCCLVAVARPGYALETGDPEIKLLWEKVRERTLILRIPGLDIAASELRQRVREGRTVRYLLPAAVLDYIEEHGLYRENI